jgi:hypothetical protein
MRGQSTLLLYWARSERSVSRLLSPGDLLDSMYSRICSVNKTRSSARSLLNNSVGAYLLNIVCRLCFIRGDDLQQSGVFSYVSLEERVPSEHPLRAVRRAVDEIFRSMNREFDGLYAKTGRPSIPPERLLRGLLLQISSPSVANACSWNNWITTCYSVGSSAWRWMSQCGTMGVQQESRETFEPGSGAKLLR